MNKNKVGALVIIGLIVAYVVFIVKGGDNGKGKINWITMEEAQAKAAKEPRKIFIEVYTDWCGFCKKMEKETFANEAVADYINKNYYAVKLNAESTEKLKYKGTTTTYKKIAEEEFKASAYPTLVVLDNSFSNKKTAEGYHSVQKLEALMK